MVCWGNKFEMPTLTVRDKRDSEFQTEEQLGDNKKFGQTLKLRLQILNSEFVKKLRKGDGEGEKEGIPEGTKDDSIARGGQALRLAVKWQKKERAVSSDKNRVRMNENPRDSSQLESFSVSG